MKTSIGDLWVESGAIFLRIDHKRLTVSLMREQFEFVRNLESRAPITPAPLVLDFGVLESIDRDAREYSVALLNPKWNSGVAMLYHTEVQRVIASFYQGFKNLSVPLVIASDRDEAVSALLSMIDGKPPTSPASSDGDRLQKIVDAVAHMASGEFDIDVFAPERQDELDAVACGIKMLAEEMANLIDTRKRAESELVAMNARLVKEITERKRMGSELERINTELEGFAHTVSHDLKGPLSAISAAARLVVHLRGMPRSREMESNIEELLWLLISNVDTADTFIEETLTLAEAGQVPKVVCSVDISSIVSHIISERSAQIAERGVRLEVGEQLGALIANPTHMYQVFSNLIGNAITHNNGADPVVRVHHLGDDGSGSTRYEVSDNGPGIPPDEIDQLFTPFFKGKFGTTGVGLSIVDRIVKVYGGTVVAKNDNGACFEITLHDFAS
ncbi:MAG: sensor histidine kinase [Candidatus Geothermincolia bacterium]